MPKQFEKVYTLEHHGDPKQRGKGTFEPQGMEKEPEKGASSRDSKKGANATREVMARMPGMVLKRSTVVSQVTGRIAEQRTPAAEKA